MKKENTGKFSYSGYTPEENKEIDRKINSWSKKELVDVIYELAERIDEGEPEKKITQALENFDNAVRTMRLWNEKNLSAGKCLEQWNSYRKNLLLYYMLNKMKKEGTQFIKEKRGELWEFAAQYDKQVFEKIKKEREKDKKESILVNISLKDPQEYIRRMRYRIEKPEQPTLYYQSIEELPYDTSVLKIRGLEQCDKAGLKSLLELMLSYSPEVLPAMIDIERCIYTQSKHKENLYNISKESYTRVKKECEEKIEEIIRTKQRCIKIEETIDKLVHR